MLRDSLVTKTHELCTSFNADVLTYSRFRVEWVGSMGWVFDPQFLWQRFSLTHTHMWEWRKTRSWSVLPWTCQRNNGLWFSSVQWYCWVFLVFYIWEKMKKKMHFYTKKSLRFLWFHIYVYSLFYSFGHCFFPISFLSIGMVRLRDGEKFGEGRVEMYHSHSKIWMQVCGEKWTQRSADTACKQRGLLGAHKG